MAVDSAGDLLIPDSGNHRVRMVAAHTCSSSCPYGLSATVAGNIYTVAGNGTLGHTGYAMVGSDGGVYSFGDAPFDGSLGGTKLNAPIVGMAADPSTVGYWLVASNGGVFNFGDAPFDGSLGATKLNAPIVGMAGDPETGGYWLVASDGGVFAFDAPFHGSLGGTKLNPPIVGIATPVSSS